MKPTEPMVTVDASTGHKWEIFSNGHIEGFGNDKIILNRIPHFMSAAQLTERHYLRWEPRKASGGISSWISERLRSLVAKGSM